ncbi:MAG: FadR/GntR family transcriptional regulator [Arenicella sp.]
MSTNSTKPAPKDLFSQDDSFRKITLKDQLADKLAHMISAGLIAEGDNIPSERSLSETFNVSRETVRGALQILADLNYIEVAHGSRTKALKVDKKSTDNSLHSGVLQVQSYDAATVGETRVVIETAILRSAAMNISDTDLDRLQNLIVAQEKMSNDTVAFHISDREFHTIIYEAGGNALLSKMAGDVYSYALESRHVAMQEENAIQRSVNEHKVLYRALASHDPDAAERAVRGHLDSIQKSTLRALERQK